MCLNLRLEGCRHSGLEESVPSGCVLNPDLELCLNSGRSVCQKPGFGGNLVYFARIRDLQCSEIGSCCLLESGLAVCQIRVLLCASIGSCCVTDSGSVSPGPDLNPNIYFSFISKDFPHTILIRIRVLLHMNKKMFNKDE